MENPIEKIERKPVRIILTSLEDVHIIEPLKNLGDVDKELIFAGGRSFRKTGLIRQLAFILALHENLTWPVTFEFKAPSELNFPEPYLPELRYKDYINPNLGKKIPIQGKSSKKGKNNQFGSKFHK